MTDGEEADDASALRLAPLVIGSLVVIDLVLFLWGYGWPELWFEVWHGAELVDPQALLQRSAGHWLAFFLLQTVALFRHRDERVWLALVAGARFSDCLTDLSVLAFASSTTLAAQLLFPVAAVGNLIAGLVLLRAYRARRDS